MVEKSFPKLNKPKWGKTHETGYKEALEGKVGKTTLCREERYSGLVSRTVLKTSPGWKQFGLSLTQYALLLYDYLGLQPDISL